MFEYLKKEHEGAIALEAMIQTPLIYVTFLMVMYMFFMGLSYISYNNIANNIASDLNMRQTGYNSAFIQNQTMPQIWSYRTSNGGTDSGKYLGYSDIEIQNDNPYLRGALYSSLSKQSEGFIIPFTEITKVKVTTSKEIDPSQGSRMAGNVIMVTITFNSFLGFNLLDSGGLSITEMTAIGYGIIS